MLVHQLPAIPAKEYLRIRKAKYFAATDVNNGSAHHVQMLSIRVYKFLSLAL